MENKKIIIFLMISSCFFYGCKNRQQQTEMEDINVLLDDLISEQYTWLNNLDTSYKTRYDWPDSIYKYGNYLIDHIDMQNASFVYSYNRFNKEFGKSQFTINSNFSKDYVKTKIKMLQYYALSEEIRAFYYLHFQVDLMGFSILNDTISKGETERLCLMPEYNYGNPKKSPIFVVNSDTLKFNGHFPYRYYYDFYSNKGDTTINITSKITVWMWDRYFTFEASAPIYVKK
jgi:hypothetical protein